MKSYCSSKSVWCVLGVLLLVAGSGCEEFSRWSPTNARFERTIAQQIAMDGSDMLDVLTESGSITVTGSDVADCNIVARVIAHAPTEEEAQELAEQVEILGQPTGSTLKVRARKPDLTNNRSIGISYTITVPRRMNVRCDSGYGRLNVSQIEGRLDGKSGNGSIMAQDIRGATDLNSSYGSIECRSVTGQSITLHSGNGSITATACRGSLTAETAYGSIGCEDFSDGDLRLKSGNGRIGISRASFGVCDVRSSYGAIAGNTLKGDAIELHSGNGSVEIDDVQAKGLALSSSYGGIRATQVAAPKIEASSGNGGVRIACSPAATTDLDAQVKSSYGAVEFTAPPQFSGEVYLYTGYGSIRTALPITMSGEITRQKVTGRIGEGTGKIRLESGNGSIELQ